MMMERGRGRRGERERERERGSEKKIGEKEGGGRWGGEINTIHASEWW